MTELLSPAISARMCFASQCFQVARVQTFPLHSHSIVASQLTGIQHSQCMQPRMLLEQWSILTVCCYDNRPDVQEIIWSLMAWQTSCWNGFDVVLKVVMINPDFFRKIRIANGQQHSFMGVWRGAQRACSPGFWKRKQKKVVFLVSSGKKQISSLLVPLE